MISKVNWVFFGSSEFSIYVLDELKLHNILPDLIVTTPDKPKGRKLVLSPTPVKVWANQKHIEVIDPKSLRDNSDLVYKLKSNNYNLFLVASYGKIIPKEIFDIPKYKTLNIHPSMLPKYRGASPIQSQILNDEKEVGVTIMQIEETMDTGPIIIQKQILFSQAPSELGMRRNNFWPIGRVELEKILATEGAKLFSHILPEWVQGGINPIMQNEDRATYCKKITKEDGLIDLVVDTLSTGRQAHQNLLKIKALEGWPTAYFFHNNKRIIIKDATIKDDKLEILRVIPEGKKEVSFADFIRGNK